MTNTTSIKIPKKYQDRVECVEHDQDGYWLYLYDGWNWGDRGLHTIHEDTQSEVLRCLRETFRNEAETKRRKDFQQAAADFGWPLKDD